MNAKTLMMKYIYVNGDYPTLELWTKEFGYERSYYYKTKKALQQINYKERCHEDKSLYPFEDTVSKLLGVRPKDLEPVKFKEEEVDLTKLEVEGRPIPEEYCEDYYKVR